MELIFGKYVELWKPIPQSLSHMDDDPMLHLFNSISYESNR